MIKKSFASHSHFVVALLAIALMLALPTVAHAETKRYSVPNASFEIWLNDDGSAEVEETWEVAYEEGDFTRFYKDIYTSGLETEERFSNISVKKVTINGKKCSHTNDTVGRPDYHYNVSTMGYCKEIAAYLASHNQTNTYVFRYVLSDVVKNVDDQYGFFSYRLVGTNFDKMIDQLSVLVHAPEMS